MIWPNIAETHRCEAHNEANCELLEGVIHEKDRNSNQKKLAHTLNNLRAAGVGSRSKRSQFTPGAEADAPQTSKREIRIDS